MDFNAYLLVFILFVSQWRRCRGHLDGDQASQLQLVELRNAEVLLRAEHTRNSRWTCGRERIQKTLHQLSTEAHP